MCWAAQCRPEGHTAVVAYGSSRNTVIRFFVPTRVDLVVETLEALDFKYNVAMVLEAFGQGAGGSVVPVMHLLEDSRDAGVVMTNYALKSYVEDIARLELHNLSTANSFDISLSGIAEALKTLVAVLDPTGRRKAKEDARHEGAMHLVAEDSARETVRHEAETHRTEERSARVNLESAELDLHKKRWEVAEVQFDRLVRSAVDGLNPHLVAEMREVYVRELARDLFAIGPGRVEIIEPPED
jgi:hypothetical protein